MLFLSGFCFTNPVLMAFHFLFSHETGTQREKNRNK